MRRSALSPFAHLTDRLGQARRRDRKALRAHPDQPALRAGPDPARPPLTHKRNREAERSIARKRPSTAAAITPTRALSARRTSSPGAAIASGLRAIPPRAQASIRHYTARPKRSLKAAPDRMRKRPMSYLLELLGRGLIAHMVGAPSTPSSARIPRVRCRTSCTRAAEQPDDDALQIHLGSRYLRTDNRSAAKGAFQSILTREPEISSRGSGWPAPRTNSVNSIPRR